MFVATVPIDLFTYRFGGTILEISVKAVLQFQWIAQIQTCFGQMLLDNRLHIPCRSSFCPAVFVKDVNLAGAHTRTPYLYSPDGFHIVDDRHFFIIIFTYVIRPAAVREQSSTIGVHKES